MSAGLQVSGLNVALRAGGAIVKGVDLNVAPGQVVALVGESGCGKSTLLRALVGLLPRSTHWTLGGEARWANTALIGGAPPDWTQIRGPKIGFVFQEPQDALNPTRCVFEQVQLGFHRLPRGERRVRAERVLSRVGLSDLTSRGRAYPHELSGGQRQRVLVAMAIAQEPELILADVPTSHLDLTLQSQILEILAEQARTQNTAVLWVSHDLATVSRVADHVHVMYAGRIVESGPSADVLRATRHPYTAALIAALPAQGKLPKPIQGEVAEVLRPASGCAFFPRCAHSEPECRERRPELEAKEGHQWACWHPRGPQSP